MTNPHALLISDLHLCAERPHITTLLLDFLQREAQNAEALYILGDLFEYWAGDDDRDTPFHRMIIEAFRTLSDSGTAIYLMHGNRDFLLGPEFAAAAGITLLGDPIIVHLYGQRALLTHGDLMCTDDLAYQKFRDQVRSPAWQRAFLAQPLELRKTQIEALRMRSEHEKAYKPDAIMDVNPEAINALLRAHDYPPLLIHGHTHRPAKHHLEVDGRPCTRWVLGDWDITGNRLRLDNTGVDWEIFR